MEVALRLLGKQDLPRVVTTPQALITKDNVESFAVKGDDLRKVLLSQPAD
jgi:ribose transport system substrate-binding protein